MSELKTLTFSDSETGLFTSAQIRHLMKIEFARARRYRLPLSFVVLNVDRLHDLARSFGYKAKELVLERFHSILRREARSCDFTGRFTDDRVILLLPHTDSRGAKNLVTRIRRGVASQEFNFEGKAFKVTISAGISQYREKNTLFFDSLRDAAEEAANRASATGDSVVALEPDEASKEPKPTP